MNVGSEPGQIPDHCLRVWQDQIVHNQLLLLDLGPAQG